LALIDVEINIYGRNREQTLRLDDPLRGDIRKYVTNCALRRADVGGHLMRFQEQMNLSRNLQAAGNAPEAGRVKTAAEYILNDAHKATDELISTAKEGNSLVDRLQKLS
jgi:hypothetical protein